ncbi:hypothetical protein LTR56_026882 [Elasticomyces elasticus]|nr:hypothetical protein LTR56_026882 [Elasticomyces elasticus]
MSRGDSLEKFKAQSKDTSGIDTKILKPAPVEAAVAIKTEPKKDSPKLEGPEPKRSDRGPPSKYANQYPSKRLRASSPSPVERQIQGLSKQIDTLAENLVEIRELLVKQSTVDDIVLDYDLPGSSWDDDTAGPHSPFRYSR